MQRLEQHWGTILVLFSGILFLLYCFQYLHLEASLSLQAATFIIGLKSIPVFAFLPFLIKRRKLTSLAFSFLLFVYFSLAAINAFRAGALGQIAIIELCLLVFIFTCSFMLGKAQKSDA